MNENDRVRDLILRHLYEVHKKAKGMKGVAIGIRDLQSAMKKVGVKQADVNANLDYLIQKGWAKDVVSKRSFTTKRGTTQDSEQVTYKISDVGIDRLEAASTYRREESFSRINVTTVNGVTVIGSGNIVNTGYQDLSKVLSEIEQGLTTATGITEEDRLNALADVSTIQSQLAKPTPNTSVIKQVWAGVEKIVTAAGFTELVMKAGAFIAAMVTG